MMLTSHVDFVSPSVSHFVLSCPLHLFEQKELHLLVTIAPKYCQLSSFQDFWVVNNSIQSTIILLIEQIVVALGGEFKLYLPQLIPHMLRVLMHDSSSTRSVSTKVSTIVCKQSNPESCL